MKFIIVQAVIHRTSSFLITLKPYVYSTLSTVLQAACNLTGVSFEVMSPKVVSEHFHSFIPLACAEFDDPLPFSGASSIHLYYVLFLAPLPHQLFFYPPSPHLAINFLVRLSILLFPNSYTGVTGGTDQTSGGCSLC